MPHNQPMPPQKQPVVAPTDCPRRCNVCSSDRVALHSIAYDIEVKHDGRVYQVHVPNLQIPICEACNAKVFTEDVDAQINHALRLQVGLLTPEQIRANIDRIGMSQKQVAECLGIAEATLSRWLNQTQIQSRSMDTLLRMFFSFPHARQLLLAGNGANSLGFVEYSS